MAALDVADALSAAIDDPEVAAIVFRIDSPGGSYVGSDTIWREVQRASDLGKPVVVSMGNLAARSEEHTSELQSLMRFSYAVFCLKNNTTEQPHNDAMQST